MPPVPLSPAPAQLGFASPALGPWFQHDSDTGFDPEIPAPSDQLGLALSLPAGARWLPPTSGLFGLYVEPEEHPPDGLRRLRTPTGQRPFRPGNIVGLFRLMPDAERRLHRLCRHIPSVTSTGTPAGPSEQPTRPAVRWVALDIGPAATVPIDQLAGQMVDPPALTGDELGPSPAPTPADRAQHLGLELGGASLRSGDKPMADLKRPGMPAFQPPFVGAETLLRFPIGRDVRLWAFDRDGRALDPGAVAAWWSYLATTVANNLWAGGIANARTCRAAPARSVVLVDAHEAALEAEALARIQVAGRTPERPLQTVATGADFTVTLPAPNVAAATGAPLLSAVLPDGGYARTASCWPAGSTAPARDFARVAVVDVEYHLTGLRRAAPEGAPPGAGRRAADQLRRSTRVEVARMPIPPATPGSGPLLHATLDEAAGAVIGALAGPGASRFAAGVIERDWGPFPDDANLPDVEPPMWLPELVDGQPAVTAETLAGSGRDDGGTLRDQKVLISVRFPAAAGLAGAWVRAYAQGFDTVRGRRARLDGGAGRVNSANLARLVIKLPDGDRTPLGPMALDLHVTTRPTVRGERRLRSSLLPERRFTRPPVRAAVASSMGAAALICETAAEAPLSALAAVPPGATVVRLGTPPAPPALVSDLPNSAFAETAVVRQLGAGDIVALVQPAFRAQPEGDTAAAFDGTGAIVRRPLRRGLSRWTGQLSPAGFPLPGMERLEVAASHLPPAGATPLAPSGWSAALAAGPALRDRHERPAHQHGHPGVPAGPETHGTGATLRGDGARLLAEFLRERCASWVTSRPAERFVGGWTGELVAEAATPLPSLQAVPEAEPAQWAAVLRTVAAAVECEIGLAEVAVNRPVSETVDELYGWLMTAVSQLAQTAGIPFTPPTLSAGQQDIKASIVRAVDRRLLAGAYGLREAGWALQEAIGRAQDLVYLETPALDDRRGGVRPAGDEIEQGGELALLDKLIQRLNDRPALHAVIVVAAASLPGTPRGVETQRRRLVDRAVEQLRSRVRGTGRVGIVSPAAGPGRPLHLASTTAIIDDAFCLTGTTHLWRRGLTFDASLACTVFDERLIAGRPAEIVTFRRRLIADRLGLPSPEYVPEDPAELVAALLALTTGGSDRLFSEPSAPPSERPNEPVPSSLPAPSAPDPYNPDGSRGVSISLLDVLLPYAMDSATP